VHEPASGLCKRILQLAHVDSYFGLAITPVLTHCENQ
jgi:hypothetical protein